tara:strand:+ start:2791 stop:3402 length:612 start_codon:yes stop_codon:yes gene_type:complete
MDVMSQVGSIKLASEALNVSETSLRKRISTDKQLRSLYITESPVSPVPDEIEAMVRQPKPKEDNDKLAKAIKNMNNQLLNEGLRKAGISDETCRKLELFSEMDDNGWRMLIGGLDLMHRMLLYQAAALFQEAERCRSDELEDDAIEWEQRVAAQKHYNDICKTLINTYDRVLSGTLASVKMAESTTPKKKAKPGYAPLNEKKG